MLTELRLLARVLGPRLAPDCTDNYDPELAELVARLVRRMGKLFRAEVHGLEQMPTGPALIVGNHNAGITFLEPLFFGAEWLRRTQGQDPPLALGHDAMMALPLMGNLLMRLGVVRACPQMADHALEHGRKLVVFPGGNTEAFRPFYERHRVDLAGRTGFARLALRHQVPIVPLLSIGGHETLMVLYRSKRLARLTGLKRLLRSETFPISLALPWGLALGPLFHLPLPAKLLAEVGQPMALGHGPEAADDPAVLREVGDRVQARLQQMMDRRAAQRLLPILG